MHSGWEGASPLLTTKLLLGGSQSFHWELIFTPPRPTCRDKTSLGTSGWSRVRQSTPHRSVDPATGGREGTVYDGWVALTASLKDWINVCRRREQTRNEKSKEFSTLPTTPGNSPLALASRWLSRGSKCQLIAALSCLRLPVHEDESLHSPSVGSSRPIMWNAYRGSGPNPTRSAVCKARAAANFAAALKQCCRKMCHTSAYRCMAIGFVRWELRIVVLSSWNKLV